LWPPHERRQERLHRVLWWVATVAAIALAAGLIEKAI
jgi:predicted cobalt transporter CbtA